MFVAPTEEVRRILLVRGELEFPLLFSVQRLRRGRRWLRNPSVARLDGRLLLRLLCASGGASLHFLLLDVLVLEAILVPVSDGQFGCLQGEGILLHVI